MINKIHRKLLAYSGLKIDVLRKDRESHPNISLNLQMLDATVARLLFMNW